MGRTVDLRVRDSGVGIAPEMLDRIFDLFVQEPQALDRSKGGLGLGLTIVRSLVELHGGTVRARSERPGTGSEFVVAAAGAARRRPARRCRSRAPGGDPRRRKPAMDARRVLIVDDNGDAAESSPRS